MHEPHVGNAMGQQTINIKGSRHDLPRLLEILKRNNDELEERLMQQRFFQWHGVGLGHRLPAIGKQVLVLKGHKAYFGAFDTVDGLNPIFLAAGREGPFTPDYWAELPHSYVSRNSDD